MTAQIGITDQAIQQSTYCGGTGGGVFNCIFGNYIESIEMFANSTSTPYPLVGIKVSFDSQDTLLIGTKGIPVMTVPLASDSIATMYIQIINIPHFGGNGIGVGAIYIETIQGYTYSAGATDSPTTNPQGWTLVTSSADNVTPAKNIVLVGFSGRSGALIDGLTCLYKNDILTSRVVDDFNYSELTTTAPTPINVATAIVHNQTIETQQMSVTFEKSVTSSYTWGVEAGISIGVEATFKTGIPFIAEGDVSVSTEISFSASFGEEHTTSDTFSYTAEVSVPSNTAITANATATTANVSGTYTANFTKNWAHAGAIIQQINGSIDGLTAYNVEVTYQNAPSQSTFKGVS